MVRVRECASVVRMVEEWHTRACAIAIVVPRYVGVWVDAGGEGEGTRHSCPYVFNSHTRAFPFRCPQRYA